MMQPPSSTLSRSRKPSLSSRGRAKVALIERASAFGELDPPQLTRAGFMRLLNAVLRDRDIESIDASATMPSQEPDRSAEAVRRVLPELRQLDRYERRAASQRERAVSGVYMVEENLGYSCTAAKTKPIFLNSSNDLRKSATPKVSFDECESKRQTDAKGSVLCLRRAVYERV